MTGGNMERVLRVMADKGASDAYLSANTAIVIKIHGQMVQMSEQLLTHEQILELLSEVLSPAQLQRLNDEHELNAGIPVADVGTFRLSAFWQRGSLAAVFRSIPADIPSLESLALPPVLGKIVLERRGLILMAGATGSGKSTTLAAMLDHRNEQTTGHILTIEDPIEFLFNNKRSIVNQREIGRDTESLETALRNALRQAPDCILIGEIRDRETMSAAISYALSGHLVLATMHANNSYHALGRILSFYPPESRAPLLSDLSAGLRSIISQRLLRANEGGRLPAVEILLNTKLTAELIEKGDFEAVREAMESSMAMGSQTFEQDLVHMVENGLVSRDEALAFADSPTNLMWRLQNADQAAQEAEALANTKESDVATFTDLVVDVMPEGAERVPELANPWGNR